MFHSRRTRLRVTWSVFFLSLTVLLRAQEMWGITSSNYAGSTGTLLNPTSILTSKVYMDVNLMTADIFFENNYAYIHAADYSPLMFFSANPEFPKYGPDEMPVDHVKGKNNRYVYSSVLLKGPSFMMAVGRHAFALHTSARVLTSANAIPYEIPNFGYYGLDYTNQQNINYTSKNFGAGSLAMGEIGLSYAFAFRRIDMEDWTAGITIKRLFSIGGGYMRANDLDYIVINDTTINIRNLNAEVGFSFPMNYDNNDFPDDGPLIKGGGFGIDLGVTFQDRMLSYQKKRISKLCRQRYIDYTYRIGVSLLDIGYVNFKKNAQLHTYNDVSEYWINIDTLNYYNLNQLTRTISDVFYGDPDSSLTDNKITVFLPTAISIQADYKINRNWYAGGVFIQPIRLGKSYIRRPAQIALIPRYETQRFEVAVPISLYDYKYPRLGASVRYSFLTIGTDELLGFLGLTRFTGLDFYISVKFNLIRGKCAKNNRNVPCENEEYGIRKKR
jgi:hypothetical protein